MWATETTGTSKTTILTKDGLPIARFYADRFDAKMLRQMVHALNKGLVGE